MNILPTPQTIVGTNALCSLAKIIAPYKTLLIVTDQGIVKAGIYDILRSHLEDKKIVLVDNVPQDPSIEIANELVALTRSEPIEAVIGLGGGSPLDLAKVAAALATNSKPIDAYFGIDLIENQALPLIAIPTTAGTGSEITHIAILSDEQEELKKGIVSPKLVPLHALLDPTLTVKLPKSMTAQTGIDALTHALEAYISNGANIFTDTLALKAISLIKDNILTAYNTPTDLSARENMLLGSHLAGMAFSNAGVGAVHAFAYPLGAMFHIPHGLAISLMLPTVLEFNRSACNDRFKTLDAIFKGDTLRVIRELKASLELPSSYEEGVSAIEEMSDSVLKVTRLLKNNPREVSKDQAQKLYWQALAKSSSSS